MTRLQLLIISTLLLLLAFGSAHSVWAATDGAHCIGSGPLPTGDPNFCGCTWGAVYYRDQPVSGAQVRLSFGGAEIETTTKLEPGEDYPFYSLTGLPLGAAKGDVMTLTVAYAGEQLTRTFKAWPEAAGEQQVALALHAAGSWHSWLADGYTQTLAATSNQLWLGGKNGLLAFDLTQQTSTTQSLPWSDPSVNALAFAEDGQGWAAGPHHLAHFDGDRWQEVPPPFAATLRALVLHPNGDQLWVGGGDSQGALALFDGGWRLSDKVSKPITTLSLADNALWIGTWGSGTFRYAGDGIDLEQGWTQYRVSDGLASDYLLSTVAAEDATWFGAQPYLGSAGVIGGISRYDLSADSWRTYTTTAGLPANPDPQLPTAPAPITALTIDAQNQVWAGTTSGIYRLVDETQWVNEHPITTTVRSLAPLTVGVAAALSDGTIVQFAPDQQFSNLPTVHFVDSPDSINQEQTLALQASTNSPEIVAWDWRSNRDGPLCTTALTCTLPANQLAPGQHTIQVSVQDQDGVWSAAAAIQLTIEQNRHLYLPLVSSSR